MRRRDPHKDKPILKRPPIEIYSFDFYSKDQPSEPSIEKPIIQNSPPSSRSSSYRPQIIQAPKVDYSRYFDSNNDKLSRLDRRMMEQNKVMGLIAEELKGLKDDDKPNNYQLKYKDEIEKLENKLHEMNNHSHTMKKLRHISDDMFDAHLNNAVADVRNSFRPHLPNFEKRSKKLAAVAARSLKNVRRPTRSNYPAQNPTPLPYYPEQQQPIVIKKKKKKKRRKQDPSKKYTMRDIQDRVQRLVNENLQKELYLDQKLDIPNQLKESQLNGQALEGLDAVNLPDGAKLYPAQKYGDRPMIVMPDLESSLDGSSVSKNLDPAQYWDPMNHYLNTMMMMKVLNNQGGEKNKKRRRRSTKDTESDIIIEVESEKLAKEESLLHSQSTLKDYQLPPTREMYPEKEKTHNKIVSEHSLIKSDSEYTKNYSINSLTYVTPSGRTFPSSRNVTKNTEILNENPQAEPVPIVNDRIDSPKVDNKPKEITREYKM